MADFAFAGIELSKNASDTFTPGGRIAVRIPSWTDNTGAESVSNKLFASSYPLSIFAQRLALFSCFSGLALDASHISGPRNDLADWLSRWNGSDVLPFGILPRMKAHSPKPKALKS